MTDEPLGPEITWFDVDRIAVPTGSRITVRWRTRGAWGVRITTPGGKHFETTKALGEQTFKLTASGVITARAYGADNVYDEITRVVAAFEPVTRIPLPMVGFPGPPTPVLGGSQPIPIDLTPVTLALRSHGLPDRPGAVSLAASWVTPPSQLWSTGVVTDAGRSARGGAAIRVIRSLFTARRSPFAVRGPAPFTRRSR
ncbi:hypothetical protein [Actinokineospora terrae]|uniref:Uncharacterized protein n=1 Tax=Actinokineospora terrae TaxID=155974 RepID=A0A1H9XEC1_9PSEU|nr:hypothetical protein [Actinokineospora terrae]SES44558.1 hypothetical protein SAMN04487818_114185 [Actinokineospora terrae]